MNIQIMKTVHFIRHAESQANAGEATQNGESIQLTRKGKLQAVALANSISEKPDLITCSKYIRTQQTAAPLIRKFPSVPVKILPLHEFTYLSPTVCAGATPNQRKNRVADYPEQAGPDFIHGDGAESFNQFIQRVDCCLQCIEFCESQNIFVFTHGHVLRAIWQDFLYLGFPSDKAQFSHFYQYMGLLPVPNTGHFKAIFQKHQWQIIEPQPASFLSTKFKVSTLIATQSPSPVQPILSCRRQPPCKPCDRTLFDIQGENITLLNPENPAKVSVKPQDPKAPGQAEMPVS